MKSILKIVQAYCNNDNLTKKELYTLLAYLEKERIKLVDIIDNNEIGDNN